MKKIEMPRCIQYFFVTVLCILIVCCNPYQYQTKKPLLNNVGLFEFKYKTVALGRSRVFDDYIYAGISRTTKTINGRVYNAFVFGETSKSIIAFVREDSLSIRYLDIHAMSKKKMNSKLLFDDAPLLCFDRQINDKWNVDIMNSYFEKKELTFKGCINENEDVIYTYDIENQQGYSDLGDHIVKLFYSKKAGVVKFVMQTHWFPVEVKRLK